MHQLNTSLILLFLGILGSVGIIPQPSAQQTFTPKISAESVLSKAIATLSGSVNISDVTLSGSAHRTAGADDETGTVTFKALSSGAARFDFSYPSGVSSEIHAVGQVGPSGVWSGPDGVLHPISSHNLNNGAALFPVFSLAGFMSKRNVVVNYVGQETKNDHLVHHLWLEQQFPDSPASAAALAQHLTHTDIFLDASSFLVVAVDFNMHPDDDASIDIPAELLFSDYRPVSGVPIPFHIQRFLNNGLVLDLQFENASINTGLTSAAFNIQ